MIESVNLYQYFYAVANTGNISRAAKVMYTSQPVVSKYIARLEELVGCHVSMVGVGPDRSQVIER